MIIRDLAGRQMDIKVVVPLYLFAENLTDVLDGRKLFNIRKLAAVVLQRTDQNPFFIGLGRPAMMGRVMLDKIGNGRGQDLLIVDVFLGKP